MKYRPLRHLYNIGLALSQFGNALIGGDPDESISGRSGKGRQAGSPFWTVAATVIDWAWLVLSLGYERDHCARSIERDEGAAMAIILGRSTGHVGPYPPGEGPRR